MRKSERIRELEMKCAQMEMLLDLLLISVSNVLESQGMSIESTLDAGKWYSPIDNQ